MSDWKNVWVDSPPKKELIEFQLANEEIIRGTWAPFWCGSDCPCDVAGEGDLDLEEPGCFCAYQEGSNQGLEPDPKFWREIDSNAT